MRIIKFLESSHGQRSSKRLAFIVSIFMYDIGSLWFVNKLINKNEIEAATNIWNSFAIVSLILGGYVTAELILRILGKDEKVSPNN